MKDDRQLNRPRRKIHLNNFNLFLLLFTLETMSPTLPYELIHQILLPLIPDETYWSRNHTSDRSRNGSPFGRLLRLRLVSSMTQPLQYFLLDTD